MFLRALGVFTGRGRRISAKGFTQLTSKTGPKNYYKGKGVPTVGHHTRKGEPAFAPWDCDAMTLALLGGTRHDLRLLV